MNTAQKAGRLKCKAGVFVNGHLLNPLWHSRQERHNQREEEQGRNLQRYFADFYLERISSVPETNVEKNDENDKIYSIWFQGEQAAPPLIRACFDSIRRHCHQELVVLDSGNIENFIDIPSVITDKYRQGRIKPAHYADICRVELLHNYGGYWLDSTCYATAPVPQWITDLDFFVYMAGHKYGSPYSYLQNCFIRARRGDWLLEAWRQMILDYWMRENSHLDYFQHQLMFKTIVEGNEKAAEHFSRMPHIDQDPTHHLWQDLRESKWDEELFRKATQNAFFQKTAYKNANSPSPGTIIFEMINNPNI